ncbi:MAG: SIR2 family protein [Methylocystaceae bacterium]|nr:SIR2 family protein [Methylocystaceae bacterium]
MSNKDCVKAFTSYLSKNLAWNGAEKLRQLKNMTFWCGAGFSKSWDLSYPTGVELFNIPEKNLCGNEDLNALRAQLGYDPHADLSLDEIKSIIYFLDMNEKYPDIQSRYIDRENVRILKEEISLLIKKYFNTITPEIFLNKNSYKFDQNGPLSGDQKDIIGFFNKFSRYSTGAEGVAEGIRLNFISTNYDFLIEYILDSCIGPDDTLFNYTYRGITPKKIKGFQLDTKIHDHYLVSNLIKLNGGFEIIKKGKSYEFDYRKVTAKNKCMPPKLILPSREQDYTDQYFKEIFSKAIRVLRDSQALVIVGYSMPEEDALIRYILKQFCETAEDGLQKEIFYIDFISNKKGAQKHLQDKVQQVFPFVGMHKLPKVYTYDDGFVNFVKDTLPSMK